MLLYAKKSSNGNVDASNITNLTGQRRLGQLNTIQATANIILTEQNDKSCTGTNKQSICKHSQSLNKSLFSGMGYMSRCRSIEGRSIPASLLKSPRLIPCIRAVPIPPPTA